MILVSVGEEPFPFDRLLGWVALFVRRGLLQEELVVQGVPARQPLPVELEPHRAPPAATFRQLAGQARAVITDAGESTLQRLEEVVVPYILVPRAQRFGEQVDDHQVELARALSGFGVPIAWGPGDLLRFLASPQRIALADLSAGTARGLGGALRNRFGDGESGPGGSER